nr:diguanylate cyclase/phosphodiesterase [uncultured bacterium]
MTALNLENHPQHHILTGYVGALLFVSAAAAVTVLLWKIFPGLSISLFFCAVMLSSWRGGWGPGLLASLLASAAFTLWVSPPGPIQETPWQSVPQIGMLFFASLFISWLMSQQKRLQAELQRARDELEQKVGKRTSELTATNVALKAEIAERKHTEALLDGQRQVLEMLAADAPLSESLGRLMRCIEERAPGMLGSVLLLDEHGVHLRHGAAPSLPLEYLRAIDGVTIGPTVGSCGTAAYLKESVIVEDIASDPRWEKYREVALPHGLRACWSTPIFDARRSVLGTFAMYYRQPALPEPEHLRLIEMATHIAALAISRHNAQLVLRASEAKLKEAQSLAQLGYWERDVVNDRITWPEETCRLWGLPEKSLTLSQADLEKMIHPDDRQLQSDALVAVMKGCRRYDLEYRIIRPSGEVRFIHVRDDVDHDEAGRPIRIFGTVQDITERKRMENALRESESQLRLVVDTIPAMAWIVRPDGSLDFINQTWLNYSGLTLQEALNDPTRTMHPDDIAGAIERWSVNLASGQPYEQEMRLRRADGQFHWFLVRTVPFRDEGGRIIRWYGTSTDIEDRKRAEEAVRESQQLLNLVLATLPVGVAVTDRAGDIVLANAASKRIWGNVIGSGQDRWAQSKGFWHESGKPIGAADWPSVRALREGQTSLNELIDIETFDGQRKTIQNSTAPIHNAETQIVGALIVNEDVTERVRVEEALRQTQADLARVGRLTMMGELAASIAHEVNQPLAAVVTNANAALRWLAAEPPNLGEAREGVRRIVRDGNRAGDVIARIRTLLKKGEPVRLPINVNDVIRETITFTRPDLRRHKVTLETELDPKLPLVHADSVQLQQVLLNLLVNALDSMSAVADRPRVLGIRSDHSEPNVIRVAVRDTGTGVDATQADHLFQAFFTTKPHGLGMGLAISRSIIEAHGGRLWMTSNDGPGVTFLFTMPARNGGST